MAIEFLCTCGHALSAPYNPELPVICPQCQAMYFAPVQQRKPTPLVKSFVARAGAWGCLMPGGVLLTLFAVRGLLTIRTEKTDWQCAGAAVALLAFVALLRQNTRSWSHCIRLLAPVCVIVLGVTAYIWHQVRKQAALDSQFATVLQDAHSVARQRGADAKQETVLKLKYLPVLLTERGALHPAETAHVETELLEALPLESQPQTNEDVHTIVVIDWCYEQTGVYVSKDAYQTPNARVYRGGCTVSVIDRDTMKLVGSRYFSVQSEAPQERPGGAQTTWYGPQPLEKDIVDYISSLQFANKP